jgi:monofunctional biosynthetic peptidoglycan transglycosylase
MRKKPSRRAKRKWPFRAGLILAGLALGFSGYVIYLSRDLPDVSRYKKKIPPTKGERIFIPLSALPGVLPKAVIASEDCEFYRHHGLDYEAIWDAFKEDIAERRIVRGGSTITQQLAKNLYLSKEKTLNRKIREALIAREMERTLSKKRILELYLNVVEWGDGIYGVEAASRRYFSKSVPEISVAEAAVLASMLPNPHYYNPDNHPEKLERRVRRLLHIMWNNRTISREQYDQAIRELAAGLLQN